MAYALNSGQSEAHAAGLACRAAQVALLLAGLTSWDARKKARALRLELRNNAA